MARIIITGGAGFIGSNLAQSLLERGDEVCVLDNFNDFYDPAIKEANAERLAQHERFRLVRGDICDAPLVNALFQEFLPDAVMHLAAWAGVRPSLEKPAVYARNNVEGTTVLLEAGRRLSNLRFCMASSSSVYGGQTEVPFREDMDVDSPISVYAATKRSCEIMARTYNTLYGMNTWCLRFFTCYGPGQRPDLAIHKFTKLIDSGQPIPVFGDGSTYRDYLYIDDCVKGVTAALDRCQGYQVINIGESRPVRLDRLIEVIESALGKKAVIERLPEQPGDVPRTFADVSLAAKLLDYAPGMEIEEGVARFVAWYREQSSAAT